MTKRPLIRPLLTALALPALAAGGILAYANWPEPPLPADAKADRVVVYKSQRKLVLLKGGAVLREYRIALGGSPVGPKQMEGDGKTPEGLYAIDYRNPRSQFHLSLHISYPRAEDMARARRDRVEPGGLIMIHGLRNGMGALGRLHRYVDWTNGCIAVTNREIEEIWRVVPDGTAIELQS